MAKTAMTVKVTIVGLRETLKAFNELPKDAAAELRDASLKLAQALAVKVKADGMADGAPQSALVATTVKARRDRVPVIEAGGTARLGRNQAPAYALLFGSVFGMNSRSGWYADPRYEGGDYQFHRPHGGTTAYWFFPVVEQSAAEISAAWNAAADRIVNKFADGGDV